MNEFVSTHNIYPRSLPFWPLVSLLVLLVASILCDIEFIVILGSWSVLNAKAFLISYLLGFNMESHLLDIKGVRNLQGFSCGLGSVVLLAGIYVNIAPWLICLAVFRYSAFYGAHNRLDKIFISSVFIRYLVLPLFFVLGFDLYFVVLCMWLGSFIFFKNNLYRAVMIYWIQVKSSWRILTYNCVKYLRNYGDKVALARFAPLSEIGMIDLTQKIFSGLGLINSSKLETRRKIVFESGAYSLSNSNLLALFSVYLFSLVLCMTPLRVLSGMLCTFANTWISLPFFVWNKTSELSNLSLIMLLPFLTIFFVENQVYLYTVLALCEICFGALLIIRNFKNIHGKYTVRKIHLS